MVQEGRLVLSRRGRLAAELHEALLVAGRTQTLAFRRRGMQPSTTERLVGDACTL